MNLPYWLKASAVGLLMVAMIGAAVWRAATPDVKPIVRSMESLQR